MCDKSFICLETHLASFTCYGVVTFVVQWKKKRMRRLKRKRRKMSNKLAFTNPNTL